LNTATVIHGDALDVMRTLEPGKEWGQ